MPHEEGAVKEIDICSNRIARDVVGNQPNRETDRTDQVCNQSVNRPALPFLAFTILQSVLRFSWSRALRWLLFHAEIVELENARAPLICISHQIHHVAARSPPNVTKLRSSL